MLLAAWIMFFNMATYVFKFMFRALYSCVLGLVFFNFDYNLSLYIYKIYLYYIPILTYYIYIVLI